MKTLATLTIASLFSLTASAGNFSNLDYEYYAESSEWPSHTSSSMSTVSAQGLSNFDYETYAESSNFPHPSLMYDASSTTNIADIQDSIEQNPTASGSMIFGDDVLMFDLFGDDIHSK